GKQICHRVHEDEQRVSPGRQLLELRGAEVVVLKSMRIGFVHTAAFGQLLRVAGRDRAVWHLPLAVVHASSDWSSGLIAPLNASSARCGFVLLGHSRTLSIRFVSSLVEQPPQPSYARRKIAVSHLRETA